MSGISPLLSFRWYQHICNNIDDSDIPSDTQGKPGHAVGIAEKARHTMCHNM